MLYTHIIKIPIYECKIHLSLGDKIDSVIRNIFKKEDLEEDPDSSYSGICVQGKDFNKYYIVIDYTVDFFNTLGHEVRHCVDYILMSRSFKLDKEMESSAYLTGYITSEIMKFVSDKNVPILFK